MIRYGAIVLGVLLSVGLAYHFGYSHGYLEANDQWSYQVRNDSSSDQLLRHSVYYDRGLAFGRSEGRYKAFNECENTIIKIAADSPKVLGAALVEGLVRPNHAIIGVCSHQYHSNSAAKQLCIADGRKAMGLPPADEPEN